MLLIPKVSIRKNVFWLKQNSIFSQLLVWCTVLGVPHLLCLQNIANPIADVIFCRARKIAVRIGFQSDPIDQTKTRPRLIYPTAGHTGKVTATRKSSPGLKYNNTNFVHSYCACYSSRLSLSIYLSSLPLTPFTVVASITSLGRSFHVSTRLLYG